MHHAWPLRGKAPKGPLARWLAKQVGPTRVKPCRIRRHGRIVACRRKKLRRKSALPPGFRGQIVRLHPDATTTTTTTTLQLIRSFDIPTSDPSYVRLLNWSWTYDSAIAAAAFGVVGDTSEAQQLLDQLSALQHTNGSIEEAFNVSTNEAESLLRSGTIATVGLAGSLYDQYAKSSRYLSMQERAASYLISLQGSNGVLRSEPFADANASRPSPLATATVRRAAGRVDGRPIDIDPQPVAELDRRRDPRRCGVAGRPDRDVSRVRSRVSRVARRGGWRLAAACRTQADALAVSQLQLICISNV